MTDYPGTARTRPFLQDRAALLAARLHADMTARQVAEEAQVSVSLIREAERGGCGLSAETLRRIADALGHPAVGLIDRVLARRVAILAGIPADSSLSGYRETLPDGDRPRYDRAATEAAQLLATRATDGEPAARHLMAEFSTLADVAGAA